ncbi:unnamed protein product [Chrysoparadoxa australica]
MGKKSKSGKNKSKSSSATNANKLDMSGLDEILNDQRAIDEAKMEAERNSDEYMKNLSGRDNAKIGMKGFQEAAKDPNMFAEAMSMLNDPEAVKQAEAMMNDPEFKAEINKYMGTLKKDANFQKAMEQAQGKFQDLMQNPAKLEEMQQQIAGLTQPGAAAAALEAAAAGKKEGEGAPAAAPADPGIED